MYALYEIPSTHVALFFGGENIFSHSELEFIFHLPSLPRDTSQAFPISLSCVLFWCVKLHLLPIFSACRIPRHISRLQKDGVSESGFIESNDGVTVNTTLDRTWK
jgi:hypothetical protein